jgi:hypothetical protein
MKPMRSLAVFFCAVSVAACDHEGRHHGLDVDPYSTAGANGTFVLDGPTFGHHQNDYGTVYYPCNGATEPGAVRFELQVSHGDDPARRYAYVTVFPQDYAKGVDLKLPWMHVTYERSDCTRLTGVTRAAENEMGRSMHGTLNLTCSDAAKNTLDLDVSFDCATR